MDLKSKIRVIEDFPKKGISFKDITTLLKDGAAFREIVDTIAEDLREKNIDIKEIILGIIIFSTVPLIITFGIIYLILLNFIYE